MAVGDARQRTDILVDHQDGEAQFLQAGEAAPDLGADQRRQAFGRLVQHDQFRLCFVWAPDGVRDVKIVDYH